MHKLLFVSVAALLAAAPAQAKTHKAGLKWSAAPPALPAGAQMAVVKGDPGKPGAFTIQLKFPANYAIPPHHHPTDETVRVLSAGQLNYGMGDKLDKANAGTLTKGYHVVMAAEMNHWVFTTDPVEVQVSGTGPFAIVYVDPKDDQRTK